MPVSPRHAGVVQYRRAYGGQVVGGDLDRRTAEASDPDTAPWRLAELADDPSLAVRLAVAANPSTSQLSLARLAADSDPQVAAAVAGRLTSA